MASSELPVEVQELLRERVRSLDHVELLLFLRRCAPQAWTASRLAVQLPWPASVGTVLQELHEAELLVMHEEGTERWYAYDPTSTALDDTVVRLAGIYLEQRADVVRALNEYVVERLRSGILRAFSGALTGWKED